MAFDRRIIPNMPAHPKAGVYVETIAGRHLYGQPGCFACPELGLWGYMGLEHVS